MELKTIEDVARLCLHCKIGFQIYFPNKQANFLSVHFNRDTLFSRFPFQTASYHEDTGELVLFTDYPSRKQVPLSEALKYYTQL